jgi:hypothetical protein
VGLKNGAPGSIYRSTNAGLSWVITGAPITNWVSVTCSADGSRIVAATAGSSPSDPNPLYLSNDSGLTWALMPSPQAWWSQIVSSADSGRLVAAATGPIYTWQSEVAPRVRIASRNGEIVLSWTIPSFAFDLQSSLNLSNWTGMEAAATMNFLTLENQVSLPTSEKSFYRLISAE